MLSVCLVHGGVGPRVFSELFEMLSGLPTRPGDIAEVDGPKLRQQLHKLRISPIYSLFDVDGLWHTYLAKRVIYT